MAGLTMKALERRIGQRRDATRAPAQAPEWRGRLRSPRIKSDSPVHNLLLTKNGLDNGGHFSGAVWTKSKDGKTGSLALT
jgi:hypothetical protein